ncbi:MAG TPA: class I SAM-dependent methyltransferase [Rhodanobacteraceae bacterium]|nr:class I SAM-dependent methyltransferase [Rhodanobacteraceae bacterium]
MNALFLARFPGSARYWEMRYRLGGTSGAGSYGPDRQYKATFLNRFFRVHEVKSVIDFGFGDGSQLQDLAMRRYLGFDVSAAAVERCRALFANDATKEFRLVGDYHGEQAEASLSLDVLYHLVEDDVFDLYLARLFSAAERWVIVYATNVEDARAVRGKHVRDRAFTAIVAARFPDFRLVESPPRPPELDNAEGASFFVFERSAA